MIQQITNFARFYTAFNRVPCPTDRDEMKKLLVLQYTDGRTDSLREMAQQEYDALCREVEKSVPNDPQREIFRRELKRKRSEVLHQMQLYGVDTSDWKTVDRFCLDKRIAGKTFRELDTCDLEVLYRKLRAMRQKKNNKQ